MKKHSAGILVYRIIASKIQILLVHPGGPYWTKKDEHAWSVPKGEAEDGEDLLVAAKREFKEETSWTVPPGKLYELGSVKSGAKVITIWAVAGYIDVSTLSSQQIEIDWPPRSDQKMKIPEVDRAAWVDLDNAKYKLHKSQTEFVDRLATRLGIEQSREKIEYTRPAQPEQGTLF